MDGKPCFWHPNKEAIGVCPRCKRSACLACLTKVSVASIEMVCRRCYRRHHSYAAHILKAILYMLTVGVIWYVSNLITNRQEIALGISVAALLGLQWWAKRQ